MLLVAFSLLLCLKVVAQKSNVILYTENGERFYAVMNGLRMNDEPVTNLKVQDLIQPSYGLKIIFENKSIGEMNKTLYLESGVEAVYAIKLDKKGGYKLTFRSSVPMSQASGPTAQQQVVVWGAPAATAVTPAPAPANTGATMGTSATVNTGNTMGTATPVGTSTTVVQQTTTTTTTSGTGMNTNVNSGNGENISMNVNTDGFGLNINVSGTGVGTTTSTQPAVTGTSTTMTTTTTTTTSGNSNAGVVSSGGAVASQPVYASPCTQMMTTDFDKATASIKAKSFEDSKMTLAKQITSKNCLSAAQVKSMMELFTFEASKLEYAKYAYDYCWEKNNYYQVNDAFEFESSISELDEYISTR